MTLCANPALCLLWMLDVDSKFMLTSQPQLLRSTRIVVQVRSRDIRASPGFAFRLGDCLATISPFRFTISIPRPLPPPTTTDQPGPRISGDPITSLAIPHLAEHD